MKTNTEYDFLVLGDGADGFYFSHLLKNVLMK